MAIEIRDLRLRSITFGYDGRPAVFDDFDFEVPDVPAVWLKGRPGMGKSSLLKILAGLIVPPTGHYRINGVDVLELSFKEFIPYRLAIGYGFDSYGLLSNRSLYENLMLPLMFHRRCSETEADSRVRFWMDRFNIGGVADQRPFAVTGSQRKSVVVLRAFIHCPQIVLLDDPTAGLKEDGLKALADLVEDGMGRNGLRRVIFSGERGIDMRKHPIKDLFLSHEPKQRAAVA